MNLELLDPFRRQIPDRVAATLSLPSRLSTAAKNDHPGDAADAVNSSATSSSNFRRGSDASQSSGRASGTLKPEKEAEDTGEDKAAYTVAFNRRGTYLAVGHASGAVAVHDFLTRTISALYRPESSSTIASSADATSGESTESPASSPSSAYPNGVTSATWSRRSRTILAGATGDARVRLIDTSHPMGAEECSAAPPESESADALQKGSSGHSKKVAVFGKGPSDCLYAKQERKLATRVYSAASVSSQVSNKRKEPAGASKVLARHPVISFSLPHPLGGSLQIHPRDVTSGLTVLDDGSLVLFHATPSAWELSSPGHEVNETTIITLDKEHSVTCAAFDPRGDKIFAATKDGILMGFDIRNVMGALTGRLTEPLAPSKPVFQMSIPGGATVWHLIVSRNGKHLLLNCADGALRLYNALDCWDDLPDMKPKVFQDVVSKVPFASCDFSGDAEYIVGGCNANDNKYELFMWNASTGALMDRLMGAQVTLNCVTWHPTRSFVAVATSDGLVDIWGPRMDWTAFAPDFQALPMNVEYIEREDEFDIVEDKKMEEEELEDSDLNVVKIEPVPVFASDSESESEVFAFETKINNVLVGRRGGSAPWMGPGGANRPPNEEL